MLEANCQQQNWGVDPRQYTENLIAKLGHIEIQNVEKIDGSDLEQVHSNLNRVMLSIQKTKKDNWGRGHQGETGSVKNFDKINKNNLSTSHLIRKELEKHLGKTGSMLAMQDKEKREKLAAHETRKS